MKLPRALHIEGSCLPVCKADPETIEFDKLKGKFLVIEEKVDGTGVSIELDTRFNLRISHRGSLATGKEFRPLHEWAESHWEDLLMLLGERYVLFGEWILNKHTIFYDNLPNFFLESDIYDKERQIWLSTMARNSLLKDHKYINRVPVIAAFKPSALWQITSLIEKNAKKTLLETDLSGMMEGFYIKEEDDFKVVNRYNYIKYGFLRTILNSGTHLNDILPTSNKLGT